MPKIECIAQQKLPGIEEWLEREGTGPYITITPNLEGLCDMANKHFSETNY